MYPSELEYWSVSWRQTKVHQDEYSCPLGSTEAPNGVHQRPVGVQMYSCTAVRGVQENVAIERMVAVGFQEKGTQRCTTENSVKNCWADTGGDIVESRSPKLPPLVKRLKSKRWLLTRRKLNTLGLYNSSLGVHYAVIMAC
jgi:hypothetical protein